MQPAGKTANKYHRDFGCIALILLCEQRGVKATSVFLSEVGDKLQVF